MISMSYVLCLPPHPHHRLSSKAKFTRRLTHSLQHTSNIYIYIYLSLCVFIHILSHIFYKRIEHILALSFSHSDSVCDGKKKNKKHNVESRQRVHTHTGHCSHSHTKVQKAWAEFRTHIHKKPHVTVHTLVKCTYGREALRDEDTHGMKSKLFGVEGNQRNNDLIQKIKKTSLHSVKGRHGGNILHDGVLIFKAAGLVYVCAVLGE